ncbi:hypothetical protein AB0C04_29765 [Micromonospora sp. NPDC048909]|uniref:hypothetical protein n=1 Tax=Micromonospora sp. NPDC048909 TaxID=3155643 RepID=UPI0033F36128
MAGGDPVGDEPARLVAAGPEGRGERLGTVTDRVALGLGLGPAVDGTGSGTAGFGPGGTCAAGLRPR